MGCPHTECKYNMFFEKLKFKNCKETETSNSFNNCMLELNESLSFEQIGEMFGISPQRVRDIEQKAIRILKNKVGSYHQFMDQVKNMEVR